MRHLTLLLLLALATSACETHSTLYEHDGELFDAIEGMPSTDHATGLGILRLVNWAAVDVAFLDLEVDLDVRAAERIVAHRQGDDAADGTWDDNPFNDLFELTDVAYVSASALQKLGDMAHELDLVPALRVEGVTFTETELEDTLVLANFASAAELDYGAGLDSRAAEAIANGGPYANLVEVAERPYVGPAALEQLRAFAPEWIGDTPIEE